MSQLEEETTEKEEKENLKDGNVVKSKLNVMYELIVLLKEEKFLMSLGCVSMITSTFCNSAVPKALGNIIDTSRDILKPRSISTDMPLMIILGGGIASFVRTFTLSTASENIQYKLRKKVFSSFLSSNESEEKSSVESLVIINDDIPTTAKMLTTTTANTLRNMSSILYSTFNMIRIDSSLFLASVSVVPLIGTTAVFFLKYIQSMRKLKSLWVVTLNEFWEERINLRQTIQFYNRQKHEIDQLEDQLSTGDKMNRSINLAQSFFMGTMFITTAFTVLGVISFGVNRVSNQKISSGALTSFATYSFLLGLGTSGFLRSAGELRNGLDAAKRVFSIIHATPCQKNDEIDDTIEVTDANTLKLNNVSYTYPTKTEPTLHNINLELEVGKITAICGRNGSGKSTLVSLISRFIQPTEGSIIVTDKYSNKDFLQLNQSTLRHLIGFVAQSPALFNSTVADNILYSNPKATPEQLSQVIKSSTIDTFYSSSKNIGKNGSSLSGGQRQKIALARVLLQNPQLLLVLDEPMNNLDKDGEEALLDEILLKNWSDRKQKPAIILITHHEKYLQHVDEVIALENGRIIAKGTVQELKESKILQQVVSMND